MIVGCGRCETRFQVPGEGRFACPSCGTANQVGSAEADPGIVTPPPQPATPEETPAPRTECEACGFSFYVGDVERAPCPMCGEQVEVGSGREGS
jgi:hypothetical protein